MVRGRDLVAREGYCELLRLLAADRDVTLSRQEVEDLASESSGIQPGELVDLLLEAGHVAQRGGRFAITRFGEQADLLIQALDGADISDVCDRLRRVGGYGHRYELVYEGMTGGFLRSLVERPGFRRLYVCSPWINPNARDASYLRHAVLTASREQEDPPEIMVLVRPADAAPPGAEEGVKPFRDVGAMVYENPRLHSKLYIREPDRRGGVALAIVGSENLTRSKHLELGIRINGDTEIIDQLIRYFMAILSRSREAA